MKKTAVFMLIILFVSICSCSASQNKKIHFDSYNHVDNPPDMKDAWICDVDDDYRPRNGIFTIPETDFDGISVAGIGNYAITNVTGITDIVIGDHIEWISDYGIGYMPNLKTVTIGKGLKDIRIGLFIDCPQLETIIIDSENPYFISYHGAIYTKDGKTLVRAWGKTNSFFEGVDTIEEFAFMNNDAITSIVLPETVTTIMQGAFTRCEKLESVILPDQIQYIGFSAFRRNSQVDVVIYANAETDFSSFANGWDDMGNEGSLVISPKKQGS